MQTINCKCGEVAKLERQTVEYVIKEENGVEIFVLTKTTFVFDCPKCGQQTREELATAD